MTGLTTCQFLSIDAHGDHCFDVAPYLDAIGVRSAEELLGVLTLALLLPIGVELFLGTDEPNAMGFITLG